MSRTITLGVVGKSTAKMASEKAEIELEAKAHAESYVESHFTADLLYTKNLIEGKVASFELPLGATEIHEYLCSNVASLKSVDLSRATKVGQGAFRNCYNVDEIDVTDAVIASLGNEAFSDLGADRLNPSENPLLLDFRKSSFKCVGKYAFGSDSTAHKMSYTEIYLPNSVNQVDNYAFQLMDHCDIYFYGDAPVLTGTNAFNGCTDVVIHASWRGAYGYAHNTNWSSRTDVKIGSFADDFEQGETLPAYDRDGYALTWYSDAEHTTAATTADGSSVYYCEPGSEKLASRVYVRAEHCTVEIKDSNDVVYDNDHPIPYGTTVTVTITAEDGMVLFNKLLNGETFTSGDSWTAESGQTLLIDVVYYDGQELPVSSILANNSPSIIAAVFEAGKALDYWSYGDKVTIQLTNLVSQEYMIVDARPERYMLASGNGYSNGVLMCSKTTGTNTFMNSTNTNANGYPGSNMCRETMPNLFALFPEEWKAVIKKVKIKSAKSGSDGTLVSADCDLFLASAYEIFGSAANSRSEENTPQFGYFVEHTLASEKIWKNPSNQAQTWWLRSPYSGSTVSFVFVNTSGASGNNNASNSNGVVPCFAL